MFHNLRGYDSHLIFNELDKFDVKIKVIPNGLEKYMAFFLNKNLVFIDSMPFMNSNLDKLAINLSDKDFKYLIEEFGSRNLELLKQKGTYPYEYMDSFERFNEEKLPDKKYFYSSIKDGKIGDDDKISDGHIAMLKMTGIELEKISDIDQYLFIEKGLRGGIYYIAKRHSKVNNEYCPDYDKNKPSTFISYLDMNNLYGWAMNEYLPYGGFE